MAKDNVTAMRENGDALYKGYADATGAMKDNVDAFVAAGQAWLNAVQHANGEVAGFWREQMQRSVEVSKALAGCTSPQAAMDIQVDYTKTSMQACVDEWQKLGDIAGQALNECWAPLRSRADAAVGKTKRTLAA